MKKLKYILLWLLPFLLSACQGGWHRWIESSDDEIKIVRYDRLMDDFVALNSYSALQRMNSEYSLATSLLIEDVLEIGKVEDPDIDRKLRQYYQDSTVQAISAEVRLQYSDMTKEEHLFTEAFEALKEADPSFVIPHVYTQVSALNQSIVVGDSILGISLDKYLGEDYPLYKDYYYDYQRRSMNRRHMVSDALFFYIADFYRTGRTRTLLDRMIYAGKVHWVVAHLLDFTWEEELSLTDEQTAWCQKNESRVWGWMLSSKVLESTDWVMTLNFMEPRQYTDVFGPGSSPMLGMWFGIRIVDEYLKNNPDKSWAEVLRMDSNIIFKDSGYNPL